MPLIDHPSGNYRFLPGIAPYSCGVVSTPGFEIGHVTFQHPVPYRQGFDRVAKFLETVQRPKAALCAMELRSPQPFTFPGFADFNHEYSEILKSWGLFVDGVNPVARTNVAPEVTPPSEPLLYGFSYSRQIAGTALPTFVVAGAGELPEGILQRDSIVALGDVSPSGLETKARFVMDLMESRLRGLGVGWERVTAVDIYTVHPLSLLLRDIVLRRMRPADSHGVHWHFSRPPIQEIEYEMDLRGVRLETRLE